VHFVRTANSINSVHSIYSILTSHTDSCQSGAIWHNSSDLLRSARARDQWSMKSMFFAESVISVVKDFFLWFEWAASPLARVIQDWLPVSSRITQV